MITVSKMVILLFILTWVHSAHAILSCSKKETVIVYLNGMRNDTDDANASKNKIKEVMEDYGRDKFDSKGKLDHKVMYNRTALLGAADLVEVLYQKMHEFDDPNKTRQLSKFLLDGRPPADEVSAAFNELENGRQ